MYPEYVTSFDGSLNTGRALQVCMVSCHLFKNFVGTSMCALLNIMYWISNEVVVNNFNKHFEELTSVKLLIHTALLNVEIKVLIMF